MKKLTFTLLAMFIACMAFSQALPFKYQSVIHDIDGKALPNKTVGLRISIVQDDNALVVYREEFTKTSDEFGIIDVEVDTEFVSYDQIISIADFSEGGIYPTDKCSYEITKAEK